MHVLLDTAATVLAGCTGWLLPRVVAGAGWRRPGWWWLDATLPAVILTALVALTARPLFSGLVVLTLGFAYAYADRSKRRVLGEPVVHTDVYQAADIFRHPKLALPFPHPWRLLGSIVPPLGLFALAFWWEPPLAGWSVRWPVLAGAGLAALFWLAGGPLNGPIGRRLRHNGPVGEPLRDTAEFGPLATLLAYGLVARAERPQRQAAVPVGEPAPLRKSTYDGQPLILVQSESFFDPRGLHPALQKLSLPNLDRCREEALQWGRLAVPSWGANTVRTEFAVLTGLEPGGLGFDSFNPYHRFARAPVTSLAWRMRAQGYRTICLHPFDRRFYSRDLVLPRLGFDCFIGEEAFVGAARLNGYVADAEVARISADILREHGQKVFLFVITMENHGPWEKVPPAISSLLPSGLGLPAQQLAAFEGYLRSLGSADAMLGSLAQMLESMGCGVLAFYGDHLPSFPGLFQALGLRDFRSDYLLWAPGSRQRPAAREDLPAHRLLEAILRGHAMPFGPGLGRQRAAGGAAVSA